MTVSLLEIANFHCPRWDEIPDEGLLSSQVTKYINTELGCILRPEEALTKMMIQNYVKAEVVPKPDGRKYKRNQIAILMVITVFKQIITIKNIGKGIQLQGELLSLEDSYNAFAGSLERALRHYFSPIVYDKKLELASMTTQPEVIGIVSVSHSFALRLLGNLIINYGGFKNLLDMAEEDLECEEDFLCEHDDLKQAQ